MKMNDKEAPNQREPCGMISTDRTQYQTLCYIIAFFFLPGHRIASRKVALKTMSVICYRSLIYVSRKKIKKYYTDEVVILNTESTLYSVIILNKNKLNEKVLTRCH